MPDESDKSRSLDLLGIKPVAESINKVTTATVDGVAAFLSRICLPAAEEFGLLLRDRVRSWRSANIAAIAQRAQEKLESSDCDGSPHAHPRLASKILEEGSWIDDPIVQDLWAGLLSASCTEDGDDDSNLVFVNILADFKKLQARLLKHVCETANKSVGPNGLPYCESLRVELKTLIHVTGESDVHRLDREIDRLRDLGMLSVFAGFRVQSGSTDADMTPSALALHLYVRCNGSRASPVEYFNLSIANSDAAKTEDTAS